MRPQTRIMARAVPSRSLVSHPKNQRRCSTSVAAHSGPASKCPARSWAATFIWEMTLPGSAGEGACIRNRESPCSCPCATLLSLNIEDLDLEFRRGRVTSKGGATEYVHWATGTARLLPRLLRGRTSGPVFLTGRRAPVSGSRAPAEADVCPETGRGRLSYPRAEYLFKQATAAHDPHEKGWTLHQLRHSALQHLAADGRTAPELQAKSRHLHLGSLGRYVQLGEQTSAQVTADADPAARRRTR